MSPTAAPAVVESTAHTSPVKSTTFETAKRDIKYLIDPSKNKGPTRRRTRALLQTFRYIAKFLFWRLYRYAKYAAVGALCTAVAGTAIGTVASGAAFVIAPTGILGGAGIGLLWGLGKFSWRVMARRVRTGDVEHASARHDEDVEHKDVSDEPVNEPRMDPW